MMETTEEMELPDISPDLEDSGESEEAVPDITGDETAEPEDTDGAHSGEDETEPEDSGEDTEADNDASDAEITGDNTETDGTGDAETETGDGQTEDETETPTESLNVNGSILILPEDYEFDPETFGLSGEAETDTAEAISPEQFTQLSEQLELLEESVSVQTDVLYGGTAVISLVLGAVLGVLLLHGFRLRRV